MTINSRLIRELDANIDELIRKGRVYSCYSVVENMAQDEVAYIHGRTGDTRVVTLSRTHQHNSNDTIEITLGEDATVSAVGTTPIVCRNMNRLSGEDGVPGFDLFSDSTISDLGTVLDQTDILAEGSGVGANTRWSSDVANELVRRHLKKNTDYALRIVNTGSAGANVYTRIFFYTLD